MLLSMLLILLQTLKEVIEPLLLSFEFYIFKSYKPAYSKANLGGLYYYILIYRAKSGTHIQ